MAQTESGNVALAAPELVLAHWASQHTPLGQLPICRLRFLDLFHHHHQLQFAFLQLQRGLVDLQIMIVGDR